MSCNLTGNVLSQVTELSKTNDELKNRIKKCNELHNIADINGTPVLSSSTYCVLDPSGNVVKATSTTSTAWSTASQGDRIIANNQTISACFPNPTRAMLDDEKRRADALRARYAEIKKARDQADALKRDLVPEHKYTRAFEGPLQLEEWNTDTSGWVALLLATVAGYLLVYTFINVNTRN